MGWGSITLLIIGGALALEGIGWAIAPDGMRRAYEEAISNLDARQLSTLGLLSTALGGLLIIAGVRLAA